MKNKFTLLFSVLLISVHCYSQVNLSDEVIWKKIGDMNYYLHATSEYEKCVEIFDSLNEIATIENPRFYLTGVNCLMKTGQAQRADSIMNSLVNSGIFSRVSLEDAKHPELEDTLVRYLIEDQGVRRMDNELKDNLINNGYGHLFADVVDLPNLVYSKRHTQGLERIIDSIGFPNKELVGYYGMKGVKIILIHSGLKTLEKYSKEFASHFGGNAYAIFVDKQCVAREDPQIYGTQASYDKS